MSAKSTVNLYHNDYKVQGSKMPDYTGFLELTREQIAELIADGKAGKEVKLKIACWEYPSKQDPNKSRFFLTSESGTYEKKGQPEPPPAPPEPPANDWNDDGDKYPF